MHVGLTSYVIAKCRVCSQSIRIETRGRSLRVKVLINGYKQGARFILYPTEANLGGLKEKSLPLLLSKGVKQNLCLNCLLAIISQFSLIIGIPG